MVSKESNIKLVVTALLLGILMAAMDNTIVATAMPTIVSELGGLDKFVWVTSAYMVTTMAGMPIFGKLSDMYGRKRFYIFGLLAFIFGSILCGTATSIVQLSIYRAIQGIGGGALMPIAFTIIFDLFPVEKRGKMTGLFGAVFGISSVAGPLLGAYITEWLSWNWIFYINIPLGIISLGLISMAYKENLQPRKQKIDWWGAITLVSAVVSLMFAVELGGKEYAWDSAQIIGLFASFGVFFIAFLFIETKASDPIISFSLFKKPIFAASQGVAFFYGATFIVATVYIPIYVQGVFGGSATNAGLILTPMMLGSVFGSSIGGIFATKTSYRNIMLVSGAFFATGVALLSTMGVDTSRGLITLYMVLLGIGVGFSFSLLSMASVHDVSPMQRGTANATNSFFRSLGMTLGVTIFGSIQNNLLTTKIKEALPPTPGMPSFGDSRALLSPEARAHIPTSILDKMTGALAGSIAETFAWALILVAAAIISIILMGNARVKVSSKDEKNAEEVITVSH